ncbi:MAG: PEP-CTERM sorting domain-containing protein [Planctomycetota bacterium]
MRQGLTMLAIGLIAAVASAQYATDFEGFTPGPINGQEGWTTVDQWGNDAWGNTGTSFDEAIVDDGTGNLAWRVSNAVTTGGLSGQPFTPVAGAVAGETSSALWNDRGPDHTQPLSPPLPGAYATTPYFYGAFDFRSATGGPQSGLAVSVSPSAKQFDGRMSYVQVVDDGANGFDLFFYETGKTTDPWGASSDWVEIASDLSYTALHSVEIYMTFVDGLADVGGELYSNDTVSVLVNGAPVHTGGSWETYFKGSDPYGTGGNHAVDSMTFALRGTAAPGTLGNGFHIENVEVSNIPEPATMALLGLGALGVLRRRRR